VETVNALIDVMFVLVEHKLMLLRTFKKRTFFITW